MKIIRTIPDLKETIKEIRKNDVSLAMVPTMGALHQGHGSLIKRAREENDLVLVSIFVNPIQFGPGEDYDSYPRDLEKDAQFCQDLGVDYIFHPDEKDMYPQGFGTLVRPPEAMTNILCGRTRPGHFQGVTTVLTKFFSLIHPDRAYFGQKDIQQLAIVRRIVEDLNLGLEIIGCPIVREEDGLAKSSRNTYLSPAERQAATVLNRSIQLGLRAYKEGEDSREALVRLISEEIKKEALAKIDYVEILDFNTFEKREKVTEGSLIAMAVYIGKTRLIDNSLI